MVWVGGLGLCAGPRLPLLHHLRPWPHPSSLMLEQCQSAGFKSPCIDSCFPLGIHTCASIPFLIVCLLQGACPESSGSARTPHFCIYFPMPMTIFITHQTVLRWCVSLLKWPGCPKKASSLSYWLRPAGLNVGYSSHGPGGACGTEMGNASLLTPTLCSLPCSLLTMWAGHRVAGAGHGCCWDRWGGQGSGHRSGHRRKGESETQSWLCPSTLWMKTLF